MDAPVYQCHKKVRALKIKGITPGEVDTLITGEGDHEFVVVQGDWMAKHKPEVGGYFVLYEDGYKSFSPAAAFESGYTLVTGEEPTLSENSRIEAIKLAMGSIYRGLYSTYDEFESDLDKFARYLRTGRTTAPSATSKAD